MPGFAEALAAAVPTALVVQVSAFRAMTYSSVIRPHVISSALGECHTHNIAPKRKQARGRVLSKEVKDVGTSKQPFLQLRVLEAKEATNLGVEPRIFS